MRRPVLFLVAALVAGLVCTLAWATTVLRCDVEDLTDLCHGAVCGTVLSKAVEFDRPKGQIWTNYRLRVDETWLGDAAGELVVSVPGGTAEGITQDFEGGASLERGERAALFLWKRDDGRFLVLGEAQGAFHVRRDAATGEDRCENDVEGLCLVDRTGKAVEAGRTRLTLDVLRSRVGVAKKAREERERAAREAAERRLEERRRRAERRAEQTRGKPGGAPAE